VAPPTLLSQARACLTPLGSVPTLAIVSGDGPYLWDEAGRRYLDVASGLGGNLLGHDAVVLASALGSAGRLPLALPEEAIDEGGAQLTSWFVQNSFADQVILTSDAAEARRVAFEVIRRYRRAREEARDEILVVGPPPESETADGQRRLFAYDDRASMAAALSERTSAVLYAPSLAVPASVCPGAEELEELKEMARAARALFVVDESGVPWGRSGRCFVWQSTTARPDLAVVGAGMAAGQPFGAVLLSRDLGRFCAKQGCGAGRRSSSLANALALATLRDVQERALFRTAEKVARVLARELSRIAVDFPCVLDTTAAGLLHVLTVGTKRDDILNSCRARGLLLATGGDDTLLILPSLDLTRGHAKALASVLREALAEVAG